MHNFTARCCAHVPRHFDCEVLTHFVHHPVINTQSETDYDRVSMENTFWLLTFAHLLLGITDPINLADFASLICD
jgi:hypothetical protein